MRVADNEAKEWAHEAMRSVYAAAPRPFPPGDLAINQAGLRRRLRHCINHLLIAGLLANPKRVSFSPCR